MPAIAPALRLTLGQQYGPLTRDYARRVEQSGGRFDTAGRALGALDRMLYGHYSNGAGGQGTVADLAHAFLSFWAPVCDFPGIAPCIIGPDTVVNGYVSSNWNLNGLSGGGTAGRFLNSQVRLNQITGSVYALGFYNNSGLNLITQQLMGARNAAQTFGLDCGANGGGTYRMRPGTGTGSITSIAGSGASGLIAVSRLAASGTNSVKFFFPTGGEQGFDIAGATPAGTETFYYGALNGGGTATTPMINRYNAAFVANGTAIDTAQIAVLRNALDALDTARANL